MSDQEALAAYEKALRLAGTAQEKRWIQMAITSCKNRMAADEQQVMDESERQRHASRLLDAAAWAGRRSQ